MKKSLSVLFAALLPTLALTTTLTATNAMAHDDAQEHCYPLAHGENGLGSRNTMSIVSLNANGREWNTFLSLKNTSLKNINVKVKFRKNDGNTFVPIRIGYNEQFLGENSPINLKQGGAILKPFETGVVAIRDSGINDSFSVEVSWQTDSCIPHAISGALKNRYIAGSQYENALVLLNGGKPF